MRYTISFATISLAVLFSIPFFSSCDMREREFAESKSSHLKEVVLSVYNADVQSPETRTSRDTDGSILWSIGESISLFYGSGDQGGSKFTSTNTEPTGIVQFKGYIDVVTGLVEGSSDIKFWGVYPYNTLNSCDGESVTAVIPDEQASGEGTFGDRQFVSIGRSDGLAMGFYNVCGGFKFQVAREDITKVTLTGNNSEDIAGTVKVSWNSDNKPVIDNFVSGKKSIVVTTGDGSAFKTGVDYYIVLPPMSFSNGFSFDFETTSGATGTRTVSATINITRSKFAWSSSAIDTGVEWVEPASSDTEFNEEAYITYVANHESWFLGGNQYVNDTYFTGATGTRFEMKFQIPSYTSMSEVTLASESGERYNDAFKVTRNSVFYRAETRDDQIDTDLTSNDIDGTSVIVLSASCNGSQVTAAVNGNEKTVSLALSSFDLGFLFSSYYHDNDEGSYTAYSAGVPDGAKLYYVKIWDGDDLVYFGHAASATCPYSSNIEHCWYEEVSQTYTFARELTMPSNADPGYGNATVRQPFGGGVDVDVPVTGITLNKTSIAFTAAGETDQLTATVAPSDATISTVTWSSSDNTVATVRSDGTVTAVGDGAATIIATANDGSGVTAECKVTMGNIVFADAEVKRICWANWNTNGDGEISYAEAAAVTSIGTVFNYKNITTFEELRFFTGLIEIPGAAFHYCSKLTSVIIPDGVTSIGSSAFSGCSSLTNIIIPDGVTSIGSSAFSGCSSLTNIIIPDGVTSIGANAFVSCTKLTSINIPDGVTNIGTQVFLSCSSLTSINIPDSVTSIEDRAFYSCSSLTNIIIPDGVTSIGQKAFSLCKSLTNISIPDGVTSIGVETFYFCSSLASISIPDSVTSIGTNAFYLCTSLTRIDITNLEAWCNIDFMDSSFSARGHLFLNGAELTEVNIPNSIEVVKPYTFQGFSGLTSINIPDSVTNIGTSAFSGCSSLTSINIPDGVTNIGDRAFYSCSSLTSINIPDSVTNIGTSAFSGCSSLTRISIPDGVTSIGTYAFASCSSLTSIYIPDGVTSIGTYAFQSCSKLTSINIPNSVTSIENSAFYGCSSLTSINIPDNLTSIENCVFYNCSKLTSINIPEGVTSIGIRSFYNCSSLTSVNIADGVTSIGDYAFTGCSNLTSIIIPSTVTSIGDSAFSDCPLSFIKILSSIVPTGGSTMFSGFVPYKFNIYVPDELVPQYKDAENWNSYANRIVGLSSFSE